MTQHTDHTPPTQQQLDEITARAAHLFEYVTLPTEADQLAGVDVPLLLADLRRARDRVAELEAYAYGCDAEGCVLPHSSWCDAAKKTATANEGCTCGKPWTGHPQPHAMHCWTVNPPRVEVEEMRKRIAELTAENAKLIRWHHEDGTEMDKQRATIARLRAELDAEKSAHRFTLRQRNNRSERLLYLRDLANTGQVQLLAEEAKDTLTASINDHLPADTDEMAASLRRDGFGDDEIANMLNPGATSVEDLASADNPTQLRWGLNDVLWGDDDTVTVLMSGPDREPYWLELEPERAAVLRQDLAGPDGEQAFRALTPSEYNTAWHAVEGAAGEEGADPGTVLHAVLDRLGIGWQDAAHPAAASAAGGAR